MINPKLDERGYTSLSLIHSPELKNYPSDYYGSLCTNAMPTRFFISNQPNWRDIGYPYLYGHDIHRDDGSFRDKLIKDPRKRHS